MEQVDSSPPPQENSQPSDPEISQAEIEHEKKAAAAEDDNASDDEEGSLDNVDSVVEDEDDKVMVGGEIDTPAFALLAGVVEDDQEENNKAKVSIPLTRLPATLGRSHETNDKNFFGVGNRKALSRQQVNIITWREFVFCGYYVPHKLYSCLCSCNDILHGLTLVARFFLVFYRHYTLCSVSFRFKILWVDLWDNTMPNPMN